LEKDPRMSRAGSGGSINAFFSLLIGVISQRFVVVRKKGGTSTLGERSPTGPIGITQRGRHRKEGGLKGRGALPHH